MQKRLPQQCLLPQGAPRASVVCWSKPITQQRASSVSPTEGTGSVAKKREQSKREKASGAIVVCSDLKGSEW